jgi:hypothetical protein
MIFRLLLLIALACGTSGCFMIGYEFERPLGYVELYAPAENGLFQLRIPYKVTGRGNVHAPFDYSKREYIDDVWIALDGREGIIPLDGQRITFCPIGFNRWYSSRGRVQGTVEFRADTVRIDLYFPRRFDEQGNVTRREPFQYNGEWKLNQAPDAVLQPPVPSGNCEAEGPRKDIPPVKCN